MEGSAEMKEETMPPGFRFHPTDEELITYYLVNKISDANFTGKAIGDVDLNKCEPWDLPGKAKMGEKEWYFFSLRDRKYPTGVRTNRATNTGYWKTTGKDKEIFNSNTSELVGMKKTLVFYKGRAPRGEKSNWVMHEYRVQNSKSAYRTSKQDEWVVCRVVRKSAAGKKYPSNHSRVVNPYTYTNLDLSQISMSSQMIQPDNFQFPLGRNYMTPAELHEYNKVFRSGGSTSMSVQIPQHINYGVVGGGGGEGEGEAGTFTISGLNLKLGGGAAPTQQQFIRPPPLAPPMNSQDVTSSMLADAAGYGGEMNNANAMNDRFMGMENCPDLDNYWPTY